MTRVEKYRLTLVTTAAFLRRRFLTATELAVLIKTSRQTAYTRIGALRDIGKWQKSRRHKDALVIEEQVERVGVRGPARTLYRIVSGQVPGVERE